MSGRSVPALVAGCLAGAVVFGILLLAALLLDQRLSGGSGPIALLVPILFGAVGAYAGWLVGMIVFSALRRHDPEAPEGG